MELVLVRMDIKTIVVAGGPITSLVVLAPRSGAGDVSLSLPIRIGAIEAAAISTGAEGRPTRPKTHDLLLNTLHRLGATLTGVAIVDVRDTTFFASLQVTDQEGEKIEMDCRPSDAIALAVRAGVPIYAEQRVIDAAAMPDFVAVERDERAHELEEFHSFVEGLSPDDFK